MNAAKKIILLLWLVIVASLGNVSASTPGASENRVWEKSFAALETRQAKPLQTLGRHQENEGARYDNAPDSLLAPKPPDHIALGLQTGLRNFAGDLGARHLLDDPEWTEALLNAIKDPTTQFSFKLDGLIGNTAEEQVLNSIKAWTEGWGSKTDWELYKLQEAGRMHEVNFFNGGQPVTNPFK